MLNEWLDETRTWLYESNSRRIIGFLIIAAAVNSVLWSFSEPTGINFRLCGYPIYHYGVVILFTFIFFILLLPRKPIKILTVDDDPELFNNDKWQISEGSPVVSRYDDSNYGNCLKFLGGFGDASRLDINPVQGKIKFVKIIFAPQKEFQLYVYVSVNPLLNKRKEKQIWLALKDSIRKPKKGSDVEWEIPIKYNIKSNTWLEARLNLKHIVRSGLGKDASFIFNKLLAFQIRGTGVLYSLELYR